MAQTVFNLNRSKSFPLEATLATDHSWSGVTFRGTVDTNTVGFGGVLALAADGHWDDADSDAASTSWTLAMALEAGTGANKLLLKVGFVRDDSWNWTLGTGSANTLYVSTEGQMTQTAPSGSGDQVQVVGHAVTANSIFFNPEAVVAEIT
jgi:hypothetical protein